MKELYKTIAVVGLVAAVPAAWMTAVFSDASRNLIGWVIADVLIMPFGVIRGVYLWLS